MVLRIFLFTLIGWTLFSYPLRAGENDAFRSTNYPLPRFVSMASDKAYVRAGPGAQFPVKWEFRRKGLPVEIVLEFDTWRKIRDFEGAEGWVHQSLLSGRRSVLIKGDALAPVHRKPQEKARIVAQMQPQVIAWLDSCEKQWCRLEADGYKGWVNRDFIWGVYPGEMPE